MFLEDTANLLKGKELIVGLIVALLITLNIYLITKMSENKPINEVKIEHYLEK